MGAPQYEQAGADIGGTGTTNTIPRWTGSSTLGDSVITQNSSFIGVGTTSPGAKLHSFAADGTYQFAVSGTTRAVRFLTNATAAYIEGVDPTLSASFQPLIINGSTVTLANSGTPALTVNASSNVGIGTASPGAILHTLGTGTTTGIFATSSANAWVELRRSTSTTLGYIGTGSGLVTGGAAADLAFRCESGNLLFSTVATERARIDSAGNVNVGGTAAGRDPVATRSLAVTGGTSLAASLDLYGPTGSSGRNWYIYTGGTPNNGLQFFDGTAGAERARIDSSGRWLVGTTGTPTSAQIKAVVAGAGNGGQEWAAAAGGGIAVIPETAGTGSFFTFTGNVGAESYTQSFKAISTGLDVSTSGYGLKLPATPGNTDPNTLDCYADGGTANSGGVTWTPTISFGGASTGITYQAGGQVGRYTRIGNMVYATCYIVLTNKGSAAGAVRINGLPTSANTAGLFISAHIGYFANITSTGQVMGYMASNDTGFVLNQTTAAGANTALTDANFANNSAIIATIAYPVT